MSLEIREQIEGDQITVNLKKQLYAIRNEVLDYLVNHEPDEKVDALLKEADSKTHLWMQLFHDYLVTDDEYFSMVTHKILEPVFLVLNDREGCFDLLEGERDLAIEERDKLVAEIGRLKSNVEHYYGCFGGCRAWDGE